MEQTDRKMDKLIAASLNSPNYRRRGKLKKRENVKICDEDKLLCKYGVLDNLLCTVACSVL